MEFVWLPFGLCNASATLQQLMDVCLQGLSWTHMLCFIDNIIIWGSNLQENNERLKIVSERLSQFGLTMKPEKCKFAQTKVK